MADVFEPGVFESGVFEESAKGSGPFTDLGVNALPGGRFSFAPKTGGALVITPPAISAVVTTVAPTVELGSLTLIPPDANAVASTVAPVIDLGPIVVTPQAGDVTVSTSGPTVLGIIPKEIVRVSTSINRGVAVTSAMNRTVRVTCSINRGVRVITER